jgi:hypothetical protein
MADLIEEVSKPAKDATKIDLERLTKRKKLREAYAAEHL